MVQHGIGNLLVPGVSTGEMRWCTKNSVAPLVHGKMLQDAQWMPELKILLNPDFLGLFLCLNTYDKVELIN